MIAILSTLFEEPQHPISPDCLPVMSLTKESMNGDTVCISSCDCDSVSYARTSFLTMLREIAIAAVM